VIEVSWSRWDGEDCLRIGGAGPDARVCVRPRMAATVGDPPPMAGRLVGDGDEVCFLPRFAFVEGTTYAVVVEGAAAAETGEAADGGAVVERGEVVELVRPRPDRPATTEVLDIRPSVREVPRNLLRLYVRFSAPMREGCAAGHLRLVDGRGHELAGALLPTEYELWDADRCRLTVLLDPARIKRGLVPNRQAGYPLRLGSSFRVVVDDGFRDARGETLRQGAEREYQVGGDERRRVEPGDWAVTVPGGDTVDPLEIGFTRALDHALLGRCLHVVGPDGRVVDGRKDVGPEERSWRLAPVVPWARGPHRLVVDPTLEDLAGNSVQRVFDRDLTRPDDQPREAGPVEVTFRPR
jgi:hypothetical protein